MFVLLKVLTTKTKFILKFYLYLPSYLKVTTYPPKTYCPDYYAIKISNVTKHWVYSLIPRICQNFACKSIAFNLPFSNIQATCLHSAHKYFLSASYFENTAGSLDLNVSIFDPWWIFEAEVVQPVLIRTPSLAFGLSVQGENGKLNFAEDLMLQAVSRCGIDWFSFPESWKASTKRFQFLLEDPAFYRRFISFNADENIQQIWM